MKIFLTFLICISFNYSNAMGYSFFKENITKPNNLTFKPIHNITSKLFVTNEEYSFLEGQSGLKLRKGVNFFLFEDGYLYSSTNFLLYYQLKQSANKDRIKNEFLRGYGKYFFHNFSLEIGKNNFNIGPAKHGLLFSKNSEPYPLVKIETEEPLIINYFGKLDILIMKGWLTQERKDISNPSIFGLYFGWSPLNFLKLGLSRSEMFDGDGRYKLKFYEYPKMISGKEDNVPGKMDNEGFASYSISIIIPMHKWGKTIREITLYYEKAGTDIIAFWQDEDKGYDEGFFGIELIETAVQTGIIVSGSKNVFGLEYVRTANTFYSHKFFNIEGYTFKGLSLGYPFGGNLQSIYANYSHHFENSLSGQIQIGGYIVDSRENEPSMERSVFTILAKKTINNINIDIEGLLRLEKTLHYNTSRLPTPYTINIIDENKFFYTFGLSLNKHF